MAPLMSREYLEMISDDAVRHYVEAFETFRGQATDPTTTRTLNVCLLHAYERLGDQANVRAMATQVPGEVWPNNGDIRAVRESLRRLIRQLGE